MSMKPWQRNTLITIAGILLGMFLAGALQDAKADGLTYKVALRAPSGEVLMMDCTIPRPTNEVVPR